MQISSPLTPPPPTPKLHEEILKEIVQLEGLTEPFTILDFEIKT